MAPPAESMNFCVIRFSLGNVSRIVRKEETDSCIYRLTRPPEMETKGKLAWHWMDILMAFCPAGR